MGIADLSGAAPYPAGYVPSAQPKKKKDEKKRLSSSASSSTALPPRPLFGQSAASSSASTLYSMPKNKVNSGKVTKKKILRAAGGEVWEDESMLEWDPNDFRLFCGDLGNEVGDELLTRTFSKYPSFVKAKIVRDKKTTKSKGYGFVSFKDPNDFVAALKEMDGKYVGNRPIKLRKSTWEDRSVEMKNLRKVVTGGLVKK
ncbi:hypothetical protein BCR33DRAFT_711434 [Rhizoclosmatium globosum]|uniref:RRM domain-containing protein n=1 Tax=Rhizoclosmatium globosum TaxID=329046 RepID=A0A1Y2D1P2_9FUNG|nr:hypothetical protein BCR33DRAFT_711434 [Rhizoclosmatium globosum]|eukprot:ORY53046.1 hypothetical protein BCR33DRAFT_711434 [Rhizoclosmatium globosum]